MRSLLSCCFALPCRSCCFSVALCVSRPCRMSNCHWQNFCSPKVARSGFFMSNHVRPKMYPLLPRQGLHMYASRLAIVDAVAAVDAAVLWHVVAVVPFGGAFKSSPSWATTVQSDRVVLLVVHVLSSSLDLLHQVSSSPLTFPIRTCSFAHLIAVARCQ